MPLLAPAKLNLGLRIVGRRPDGYHELESVFAPIDLADELAIEIEEHSRGPAEVELELAGADPEVPGGASNLAARAAREFLAAAGLRARVRIALAKRIPAAAGLGGGSSDAGAVLRALAGRWPAALRRDALAALALGLGADVPFFLDPRPALVGGIGERREELPGPLPPLALLLANPGRAVPTASVFAAYAASARLAALVENDLEPAAHAVCPELAPLRAALHASGALAVGLSGSGGTLYGIFASPDDAEAALARLPLRAPAWARLARTVESG